jgi:RHS repeat-associated protein
VTPITPGQQLIAGLGLYHYKARFYSPALGRFLQTDPIGTADDLNLYAYVGGNPVNLTDPSGMAAAEAKMLGGKVASSVSNWWEEGTARLMEGPSIHDLHMLNAVPALGAIRGVGAVAKGAGTAAKGSGEAIQVTKSGVALPSGAKHQIPEGYVQNPYRSGSYGEVVGGKFKERLRIDPATPLGQKGPDYSHYHRDGKGTHYSPRPGDKDPGLRP